MPERVMGNHPAIIRPDNGPEFTSTALGRWAYGRGRARARVYPSWQTYGKRHIESFNDRLREEYLKAQAYTSLAEAKQIIEDWRQDYNPVRPHRAFAGMSPEEYRKAVKEGTPQPRSPILSLIYSIGIMSRHSAPTLAWHVLVEFASFDCDGQFFDGNFTFVRGE